MIRMTTISAILAFGLAACAGAEPTHREGKGPADIKAPAFSGATVTGGTVRGPGG